MQDIGLICDSRMLKAWDFWPSICNAITVHDSMPADCLVKVVERILDDTEAEILNVKEQPEDRRF